MSHASSCPSAVSRLARARDNCRDFIKIEASIDLEKDGKMALLWERLSRKADRAETDALADAIDAVDTRITTEADKLQAQIDLLKPAAKQAIAESLQPVSTQVTVAINMGEQAAARLAKLEGTAPCDKRLDCFFGNFRSFCSDYNDAQDAIANALDDFGNAADLAAAKGPLKDLVNAIMGLLKTVKSGIACGVAQCC